MSAAAWGRAAIASHLLLLGLVFSWVIWFLPAQHWPRPLLLVLVVLPLALPLRGLLHGRPHSFFWAAFLSLPYALHGGAECWVGEYSVWLPLAELLCALGLFLSSAQYLRSSIPPDP
jgi:uncharacterized membrane protein